MSEYLPLWALVSYTDLKMEHFGILNKIGISYGFNYIPDTDG